MTKFVPSTAGWINVNTIARAVFQKGERRYSLFDAADDSLGSVADYEFDPREEAEAAYVPSTGIVATLVGVDSTERATEKDLFTRRLHVIAWKLIGGGYAEPVLTESPSGNETILIECPDGALLDAENCSHENLKTACAAVLRNAQEKWDTDHKQTK